MDTCSNFVDIYYNGRSIRDHLHGSLGLDQEFTNHLRDSGDWTMMILSWALLEACIRHALVDAGETMEEAGFFPMAGRDGLASKAKKRGLISAPEYQFISRFTVVRNQFAHGAWRFRETFETYLSGLSQSERSRLTEAICVNVQDKASFSMRDLVFMSAISICLRLVGSAHQSAEPP